MIVRKNSNILILGIFLSFRFVRSLLLTIIPAMSELIAERGQLSCVCFKILGELQ